jgi:cytochrome c oxidase cbb3-type subunit 3/ubiquinol-cytochrome c reductase cytochrome c subunit
MRNSRLLVLGFCTIGLLFWIGCNRLPGKPTPADIELKPQQVSDFTILYQQNCSGCHGQDGRGNGAFALNNPIYLAIADEEILRHTASFGVQGTMMPAFLNSAGGTLTDKQIEILAREMRVQWSKPEELGGATPPPYAARTPGDASHGAQVYAVFCASCHGTDGKGTPRAGSIVDGSYLALVSDQGLRNLVIAGRPDLRHPDWRGYVPGRVMTAQEVTDVVAWLGSKRVADPGQPYPEVE